MYDTLDPSVVRSARGPNPIAANYTATLAVLLSHSRKVATSSASAFLRPDNPRFATGVYLIHPYDPNKIPILFVHGLISSPISWQNLTNDGKFPIGGSGKPQQRLLHPFIRFDADQR